MITDNNIKNSVENFTGRILFYYVWWILYEAKKRNIETLYFLARDGYLLREIALLFCRKFSLNINCKYLYCSRASLRMPSYHLIGKEADELLTLGGYYVTLKTLLERAQLNEEERKSIYDEIGLTGVDEEKVLQRWDLEKIRIRLSESKKFHNYINEKSVKAYETAIGYLSQEKLLEQKNLAIVDSGWTGSMQRSLRQLLCSKGFSGQITGFYFGMYVEPKEAIDGTYLTWHFNAKGKVTYKIPFCNNLFECILSAPHGMTTGYKCKNGIFEPVMLDSYTQQQLDIIKSNIEYIRLYTNNRLSNINFEQFNYKEAQKETHSLIKRYMSCPTRNEVEMYSKFLFCDDITEKYHLKLADSSQVNTLHNYSIISRILRRVFKIAPKKPIQELLWPYGTIAYLPKWKRQWYRLNVYIWEWLKYALR